MHLNQARAGSAAAMVLATLLAFPFVHAQDRSATPRPGPLPRPNHPPGVLEGQSPPLAPAQPVPRANRPAVQGEDTFETFNEAGSSAWITLRQGGSLVAGGCVDRQSAAKWTVDKAGGPVRVTAEITAAEGCQAPVTCKAETERNPGMPPMALEGAANRCQWRAHQGAPVLKAVDRSAFRVFNETQWNSWVTIYTWTGFNWRIERAACVDRGRYRDIFGVEGGVLRVRQEMVRTLEPGNCSAQVDCDSNDRSATGPRSYNGFYTVALKSNPQTCWVESKRD